LKRKSEVPEIDWELCGDCEEEDEEDAIDFSLL
jgi:hypothetical protein